MTNTENHTEKTARWKDYRDLIPGFSSLHERVAAALFEQISSISYQPAQRETEKSNEGLPGVGFIQIGTPHGYILMVPELKRAYVYALPNDTTTKGAADALLTAAGWVDYSNEGARAFVPRLVVRNTLPEQNWVPPYYALGKEIEEEVRTAQEDLHKAMPPLEEQPYFVSDLINYYAYQTKKHVTAASASGTEIKHEYESVKGADLLIDALQSLEKAGIHKVTFPKAKPEAYEEAVERMAALLKEEGVIAHEPFEFKRTVPLRSERAGPTPASDTVPEMDAVRKLLEDRRAVDTGAVDFAVKEITRLKDSNITSIGYKDDEIPGFKRDKRIAENDKAIVYYILDRIKKIGRQEYVPGEQPGHGPGKASKPSPPSGPLVPAKGSQTPPPPSTGATSSINPALRSGATSAASQPSGAPTSTGTGPVVRRDWKRAKQAFAWAKARARDVILGAVVGAGVRIGAQFAMAAFVTTTPGIAVVIGSAIIVGAAAGAASRWMVAWSKNNKEEGWWQRALFQGAVLGAVGGGIGAGAMQWLIGHGHFEGWFRQTATEAATTHRHLVKGTVTPEPGPGPDRLIEKQLGGAIRGPTHPIGVDGAYGHLPTWAAASLTSEQYARLPAELRRMASSSSPREICFFCKEASYLLFNGPQRGLPGAQSSGAMLLAHGVRVARDAGLSGPITRMLNADLAYVRAWGIGAPRNLDEAIACARRAGNAVNNYGPRLLRQPHIIRHIRLRGLTA